MLAQKYPDLADHFMQAVQSMPTDPQGFTAWKNDQLRQNLTAEQQLEQHFVTQDLGDRTRVLAMPKYGAGGARTIEGTEAAVAPTPYQQYEMTHPAETYIDTPNGMMRVSRGAPATPVTTGGIAPGQFGQAIEDAVQQIIPGANVTSRARSPQRNQAVGGVANSYHLTDNARDLTPPKGMSMGQFASTLKQSMGGQFDVINEGDHVHVEPKAGAMRGQQVVRGKSEAPSGYRWGSNGTLEAIPGGPADKGGESNLKPAPAAVVKAFVDNNQSIRNIDRAWTALSKSPAAVGARGYTPDSILQRTDPAGIEARAAIANIGSLLIHDRSGAAVTVSETPRLVPFIPKISDDAETVKKKLRQLRAALTETQDDIAGYYGPDTGYKPLPSAVKQSQSTNRQKPRGGPSVSNW